VARLPPSLLPDAISDVTLFGLAVGCGHPGPGHLLARRGRQVPPAALHPAVSLPAILACLILDGIDQTIYQQFTDLDLTGYQGYDKALDIYYLTIAYLATLRNWTNGFAFEVSRFLLYYRLAGVVLFELLHWRALLLIFPNTFEYFFIVYEAIRLRWDPERLSRKAVLLLAAAIWIFIKLPQEYWIHIAKLDTTDLIGAHPWVGFLGAAAILALVVAFRRVVRPRIPQADHAWRIAADPLPAEIADPGPPGCLDRRASQALRLETGREDRPGRLRLRDLRADPPRGGCHEPADPRRHRDPHHDRLATRTLDRASEPRHLVDFLGLYLTRSR
jgi:hypothetical protein